MSSTELLRREWTAFRTPGRLISLAVAALSVLALGLVTAAFAYFTGIEAGRRLGSRLASFVALCELLAAVVFAWLLLGELPRTVQLAGGLLVLVGVVVVKLGEGRAPGLPGGGPGGVLMGVTGMAVEPIGGMGQIPFHPATEFLPLWDEHWNMLGAGTGVGTAMQEAFDRANEALASAQLQGDLAVVAVTDGAPNCFPNSATTDLEVNRAAKWLTDRGIKTYVVGLPGAAGVQLLNDVAAQGGTTEYILPDDPKQLEDRLRTLIQETNKTVFDSCSIHLTPAADPADQLLMVVKEAKDDTLHQVPHSLTPTAGWTITPDGMQVEIVGDLCSDAMNGRFTSITFQYPCKEGEPIPPLSPS